MTQKKANNNFLIQGSILAVAGILVRVIGLIYRIPLNNILGREGIGYYSTAYDIYSILLLLSSQSMPLAVSKLVSARLAKNENKNAYKMFKGALLYALVIGIFFGLLTYFGADVLAELYKAPKCARALRVLAPTLSIVSVIGVFRGYFQGMGQMGPTAISQVLEQIVNAIVSVVAAYMLYEYGTAISGNAASYSAAGGTLGTFLGAFTALVILVYIFFRMRKDIIKDAQSDTVSKKESYLTVSKLLVCTITPVLLSTTIYQIGNLVDNAIYGNIIVSLFDYTDKLKSEIWGVYSGSYKTLTTMPIAIASAISLSIVPAVVKSFSEKNLDMVKRKIDMAIRFTMVIAIPCGIGLSVLGGPINILLFPSLGYQDMTSKMMLFSVFTVVAFSLSTITNSILQGIDRLNAPIFNSGVSLIVHLFLLPVLLIVFKFDIYGVVIGDFLFSFMICALNARAIKKYIGYKQEMKNTFLKPLMCGVIMGAISYGVYYLLNTGLTVCGLGRVVSNDISVCIAIIIAVAVYFATLIKSKGISEDDLISFPKGNMIIALCKKMHLL